MDTSNEQSVPSPQYKCTCGLLEYYPEKCSCGAVEHYWEIEVKPRTQVRFHEYGCKFIGPYNCSCGFSEDLSKNPEAAYIFKESTVGIAPSAEAFKKLLEDLKEASAKIDMSKFDVEE